MGKSEVLDFTEKSSARDILRKKLAERRNVKVNFLDVEMNCKLHTIKGMESLRQMLSDSNEQDVNRRTIEFLADQFTDIEDGQPMWTADELEESLPSKDLQVLLRIFFESNSENVEQAEKN